MGSVTTEQYRTLSAIAYMDIEEYKKGKTIGGVSFKDSASSSFSALQSSLLLDPHSRPTQHPLRLPKKNGEHRKDIA